jgi:hypothetical protein
MTASHQSEPPDDAATTRRVVGLPIETAPETVGRRIRQLQREAHALAREHVEGFAMDLESLAARAQEIAEGGEAYPVGARELASRLAEDLARKAQLLTTIMNRA